MHKRQSTFYNDFWKFREFPKEFFSINCDGAIGVMSSNDAFPRAFSNMSYTISKAALILISLMKCLSVALSENLQTFIKNRRGIK